MHIWLISDKILAAAQEGMLSFWICSDTYFFLPFPFFLLFLSTVVSLKAHFFSSTDYKNLVLGSVVCWWCISPYSSFWAFFSFLVSDESDKEAPSCIINSMEGQLMVCYCYYQWWCSRLENFNLPSEKSVIN